MINSNDILIKVIATKHKTHPIPCNQQRFVKIEHLPSGITVTKYHMSQTKAKKDCMVELEELVRLWEGN